MKIATLKIPGILICAVLFFFPGCKTSENNLPPPRIEERNKALAEVKAKYKILESATESQANMLLRHDDFRVRMMAAKRLGQISEISPKTVDTLINALKDKESSVRIKAAYALGVSKNPKALDPLIRALTHSDAATVRLAFKAIIKFGEEGIIRMIKCLNNSCSIRPVGDNNEAGESITVSFAITGVLKSLPSKYHDILFSTLSSEDPELKLKILNILETMGKNAQSAVPGLLDTLKDSNPKLQIASLKVIRQLGDVDPGIMPALNETANDYNKDVAKEAKSLIKHLVTEAKNKK